MGSENGQSLMANRMIEGLVHSFYDALITGNIETLRNILTEDAVLMFGPFRFEGIKEVEHWAAELRKMFPLLGFTETNMKIAANDITNEFTLRVIGPNKVKGRLLCLGRYTLMDGKIHHVLISPSEGILEITFGDVLGLMLI